MKKLDKIFDKYLATEGRDKKKRVRMLADLYWKTYKLIEQEKEDARCEQMIEDKRKDSKALAHLHQYVRRKQFLLFS